MNRYLVLPSGIKTHLVVSISVHLLLTHGTQTFVYAFLKL